MEYKAPRRRRSVNFLAPPPTSGSSSRDSVSRICKDSTREQPQPQIDPRLLAPGPQIDPVVWPQMPEELVGTVLSFLPVHMLVDTAKKFDSSKWNYFCAGMFGHGQNLCSSYGFVRYSPHQLMPLNPEASSSSTQLQTWLSAFEHETAQWRGLPNPPRDVQGASASPTIISGSDGLFLCLDYDYGTSSGRDGRVGVWNPILQSFRWLPPTAYISLSIGSPTEILAMFLMVDEKASAYRVLMLIGRKRCYKIHKTGSNAKEGASRRYIVYSSQSREWTHQPRDLPEFGSIFYYTLGRSTFVSAAQFVFFLGVDSTAGSLDHFIWCYAAQHDVWHRFGISKLLKDIGSPRLREGYSSLGGYLLSLVALPGTLYAAVMRKDTDLSVEDGEIDCKFIIASLEMSTIAECGADSRFQFVAQVPVRYEFQLRRNEVPRVFMYTYVLKGRSYICFALCTDGSTDPAFFDFDVCAGGWSRSFGRWPGGALNPGGALPFRPTWVAA